MESALKQIRIIWTAMVVAAFIYVWLPEYVQVQPREIPPSIMPVFAALGVSMIVAIVVFRKIYISKAELVLQRDSNDASALLRWRTGQITTMALCEGLVLYGLVLRFMGATRYQAAPMYIIGIGAFIIFRPQRVQ